MTYYTKGWKGQCLNTSLCYFEFTHSCWVSEWRKGKRERHNAAACTIDQICLVIDNFSSKFLFWSVGHQFVTFARILVPNIFSTRHGDQNDHSLERSPWVKALIYREAYNLVEMEFLSNRYLSYNNNKFYYQIKKFNLIYDNILKQKR